MRLRTYAVKNYRSIVNAELKDINSFCAIVGPNNSGKSNLLRSLIVALSTALEGDFLKTRRRNQYSYIYQGAEYSWIRDIPVSSRNNESASTTFKLTFEFSEDEKNQFYEQFHIRLAKSLQMKFELFKKETEYNIIMPGRSKAPMEAKMREIGLFIRSKLDYQYIPCVRTAELSSDYFNRLLNREISTLTSNEEYVRCISRIKEIQEPVIHALEEKLASTLRSFIPSIQNVKFPLDESRFTDAGNFSLYRSSRVRQISINDGTDTDLDEKGDGIKSLVAIGLIQGMSFDDAHNKSLVLCIEEPESHLHPDAVHSLRNVIMELAERQNVQVIITTHSPILVDKIYPNNNVLVDSNFRVSNCTSIASVRDLLGVRFGDSLVGAKKIILVEGESDRRYFLKLLRDKSTNIARMIDEHDIDIVNVRGCSKMDYQIRMYNSMIIPTLVILDNDAPGQETYNRLIATHLKQTNDVLIVKSIGMGFSEIEDIVNFDVYFEKIRNAYNIELNTTEFRNRRAKWSERVKKEADRSPTINWNDTLEDELKELLADQVEELGISAIAPYEREMVNRLLDSIDRFITNSK